MIRESFAALDRKSTLLYSAAMPAQVVVVRRTRRSLFAAPRALPDWLRSLWSVVSLKAATVEGPSGEAGAEPTRILAQAPRFPQLLIEDEATHRCIGCHVCARVCPSRCLTLETEAGTKPGVEDGPDERGVLRFELEAGACIGCGFCVESCPADALEMKLGPRVELASVSGRPITVDLLPSANIDAQGVASDAR